jgi:EmrB/QacA subfamily drug resistance transporter
MTKQIQSRRWLFFLLVATGVLLSTMDSSMINVALPNIMRSFSSTLPATQLVVLAYLSTVTISLVLWGHMADSWGKGVVYLRGMLLFAGASLGCSLSASLAQLIFLRCLQGVGAAMMMSSGPAIIKMVFPVHQLGRGLGLIGLATSCGLMCGPVVSGLLIRHLSWRGIFLVTLPLSLSMYILGHFFLLPSLAKKKDVPKKTYDWQGFVLWGLLVVVFVGLVSLHEFLSVSQLVLCVVFFIAVLLVFLWFEGHIQEPIFPFALFQERYFSTATITAALSFAVLFMILLLVPFYLDYILSKSAERIGLVMLAVPSSLVIVSPLSGWLYDRIGARILTTSGLAVSCLAVFSMTGLDGQTGEIEIALKLALLGAGQAIFLSPNSASILSRVDEKFTGVASGILATARNLGMLIGAGLSGLTFSLLFSLYSGGGSLQTFQVKQTAIFLFALHWTFGLAAGIAGIGCILSSLRHG